jgi:hypothetical protein
LGRKGKILLALEEVSGEGEKKNKRSFWQGQKQSMPMMKKKKNNKRNSGY